VSDFFHSLKTGMNDAHRIARMHNEKHKQMDDEFAVLRNLEEQNKKEYKKTRNKIY
jgi:hypothetical protein